MDLAQTELGCVLARHDSLGRGDEAGQDVEERGLARAGSARHDDVQPRLHRGVEVLHHRLGCAARSDDLFRREHLPAELPDRQARPVDRDRRDHHVHARSVLEPRVAHRLRLVDAAADRGDDAVDHAPEAVLVLECEVGELDPAPALDEDLLWPVDHDLADLRVTQQRLERPEADDLVEEDLHEALLVDRRDQRSRWLGAEVILGELEQKAPDAGAVVDVDRGGVPAQKLRVNLALRRGKRRAQQSRGLGRAELLGSRLRGRPHAFPRHKAPLGRCDGHSAVGGRPLRSARRRRHGGGRLLVAAVEPFGELHADRASVES